MEALNRPMLPCDIMSPVSNRNGMVGILKLEKPNGTQKFQNCSYHIELEAYIFIIQTKIMDKQWVSANCGCWDKKDI